MPALVRSLRLWAAVVRFLGGFPYEWGEDSAGAMFPGLKSNRRLRLWSYLMAGLQLVAIIAFRIYMCVTESVLSFESDTKGVMSNITAVVVSAATSALCVYTWLGQRKLHLLVSHLDSCSPEFNTNEWTLYRNKGLVLNVFSHLVYSVVVLFHNVKWSAEVAESRKLITILYTVGDFALYSLYLPATYFSINLLCCFLDASLDEVLLGFNSQTAPPPDSRPKVAGVSADSAETIRKIYVAEKPLADADWVQAASRRVSAIHTCQLLINQYFGFPVLVLMSLSITWLIMDTYRQLTWCHTADLAKFMVYFSYNIVNISVLCFNANLVKVKVRSRATEVKSLSQICLVLEFESCWF